MIVVTAIARFDGRGLPSRRGRRARYHFAKGKGVPSKKKRELRFSGRRFRR